jgi:hydrogenase maturation protease
MTRPGILIAGIGNIFLGDDAFGVEVVQRLAHRPLPEEVRVVDFGIRGIDLTYALLDGYETVILVDAVPRGGPPGSLYVVEPDFANSAEHLPDNTLLEMHRLDPVKVLRLAAEMGAKVERLLLVGCEPETTGGAEDMRDGLSDAVRSAVDQAIELIESLVSRLLRGERIEAKENFVHSLKEVSPCRD